MGRCQRRRLKHSGLKTALSGIGAAHRFAKLPNPVRSYQVTEAMRGVAHIYGKKVKGRAALRVAQLGHMSAALASRPPKVAARDRAICLFGTFAATRGGELGAIDTAHLGRLPGGIDLFIPKSKTDQNQEGETVFIGYAPQPELCPLRALDAWLEIANITRGPIFRRIDATGRVGHRALRTTAIRAIVKRGVKAIGVDPSPFGSHTLRTTFVTEAHRAGASELTIMKQTRQARLDTVERYLRDDDVRENITELIVR